MREASLSFRLGWRTFALTFALLLAAWGGFYYYLARSFSIQDQEDLRDRIGTLRDLLAEEPLTLNRLRRRVEKEWAARKFERIYARVFDADGTILAATPGMASEQRELFEELRRERAMAGKDLLRKTEILGQVYWMGAAQVEVPTEHGPRAFIAEVGLERTSEDAVLRELRQVLPYLLVFGGLASLWISRAAVRIALEPVEKLSDTARRVGSATLRERVDPGTLPEELRELARTFNEMLGRIEAGFDRLSRFSADMAHELRTPVHVLLGSFEVALAKPRSPAEYEALLSSGVEECERLKRIIESLLFIARCAEPGQEIRREPVSVADELAEIFSLYEAVADEARISLRLRVGDLPPVAVERTLFQRAVANLVSNAIRYSPADTTVEVTAERREGELLVCVRDQGVGIPADSLRQVGERFYRVEESRSKASGGIGLGLSIVKSILDVHGGRFTIESEVGRGTAVCLFFPFSPPASSKITKL